MRQKITTILTLLLLPTIALAQYKQENDIPYTHSTDAYAQERCKLDVYYPTDLKDVPVVVWFHGGGIEATGLSHPQTAHQTSHYVTEK